MTSRYDVIPAASQTDSAGNAYPDVMLFPWDKFSITTSPKRYAMTQQDIDRFDVTCYTEYGAWAYDDLVLWFNNIIDIHAISPGDILKFPDKTDLDRFISSNKI
jgi:hypothetical protein